MATVNSNKQLSFTAISLGLFCNNKGLTCSSMLSITVKLPPRARQSVLLSHQFLTDRDADLE